MTPLTIGILGIIVLFILMFLGMPLGWAFIIVGFLGYGVAFNFDGALSLLRTVPYTTFSDYGLSVIPLFVLMGCIAFFGKLSEELYKSAYRTFGSFRGGLAMATIFACAVFSAVSGSSVATAATMGKVCIPEMQRYKYDNGLATGCVAAGATMDIMIPPSVILIIVGLITEQSIGKLYLAGFIPGIIQALVFMLTVGIICWVSPEKGPPGPKTTLKEKVIALSKGWSALVLFVLVMGGLYFGIFDANEAAAVGAFVALLIAVAKRSINWTGFKAALADTMKTGAMIFLMICGAFIFGYFLSVTGVSKTFGEFISGTGMSRYTILILIIVIYLFLGAIMDELGMLFITLPIFFPVILKLGFDPIWFGIMVVLVVQCGLMNPPVGMNVFVIKGVAPDVPLYTIYWGIVPFVIADLFLIALLIFYPEIATFLPANMK